MFQRRLNLNTIVSGKSVLLLGPRQTGKSTLVRHHFPDALVLDLLEARTFTRLAANPAELGERVAEAVQRTKVVVIDEIQKLPALLNEVPGFRRGLSTLQEARRLSRN